MDEGAGYDPQRETGFALGAISAGLRYRHCGVAPPWHLVHIRMLLARMALHRAEVRKPMGWGLMLAPIPVEP